MPDHPVSATGPNEHRVVGRPAADGVPVDVPGFHHVRWTAEQVEAYADEVMFLHRPDGPLHRWDFRPPFRHQTWASCAYCAGGWPCRHVVWATRWMSKKG